LEKELKSLVSLVKNGSTVNNSSVSTATPELQALQLENTKLKHRLAVLKTVSLYNTVCIYVNQHFTNFQIDITHKDQQHCKIYLQCSIYLFSEDGIFCTYSTVHTHVRHVSYFVIKIIIITMINVNKFYC
jgi:hypothetical protein